MSSLNPLVMRLTVDGNEPEVNNAMVVSLSHFLNTFLPMELEDSKMPVQVHVATTLRDIGVGSEDSIETLITPLLNVLGADAPYSNLLLEIVDGSHVPFDANLIENLINRPDEAGPQYNRYILPSVLDVPPLHAIVAELKSGVEEEDDEEEEEELED